MNRSKVTKYIALLGTALVLVGCKATLSSQSQPQNGQAAVTGNSTEISHVAYLDSLSNTATSPDGMYEVAQIQPGSANLFYLDAATQQETYLCAVPNCTHDSASCNSYLPMENGEYGFTLFFFNQHLYVVQNTGTEKQGPYLMQMDSDGSNRKTIVTLKNGESFVGTVFGYGDSILCEIDKVDASGSWNRQLEKINLQDGARQVLFTYPAQKNESFTLMGAAGTDLLYLSSGTAQRQYFKVNLSSDNPSLDNWQSNTVGPTFDNETRYCNVQGDYFCTYDRGTGQLSWENLKTGEKKEFPAPALQAGETLYGLVHLYDDRFALTLDDAQGNVVQALLDSESGQLTGVRYTQTKQDSHTILGQFGDSLVYLVRIEEQPLKNQQQEGLMDELSYQSVYAVVSKEDYWNGKPGTEVKLLF